MSSILDELLPHQRKANKSLIKANEKSQKIVEKAIKKANQILTQANFFHKSLKETLRQDLKTAINKSIVVFKEEYRRSIDESIKMNQKILSDYLIDMKDQIKAELDSYTRERKKTIDRIIEEKAEDVIRRTIGDELPVSFKEKLIVKALEKAKQDGLFKGS
ncbi:hypothetical protein B6D29_00700 [Microgenomates bacterium UTCPR1]|nr:hypothetical protein [Patescibacteria group bacterium]OQY68559.1 MAG: hypothetical protein B6D29_00700 [Microgenomates bacterium UTCPR1]